MEPTIYLAVFLILIEDGRVLLLQRDNTGHEDGNWSLPAGHVEIGESATAALIRETSEEIGVALTADMVQPVLTMHRKSEKRTYIDLYFTASQYSGNVRNCEPEKCSRLLWFELDKLPLNTVAYVKHALSMLPDIAYCEFGF